MTIYVCIVIVSLIICVTIITSQIITTYNKWKKDTEYWKARYYGIAKVFDKAFKFELSDTNLNNIVKYFNEKS